MTLHGERDDLDRIAVFPEVCRAADVGGRLVSLWPLTDAKQMDNDAKYAENLQVRLTRTIAAALTGEDVTLPDAEFVYEGADDIPGRPQRVVDALLAANEAYDAMADYSETGDVELVTHAADVLGAGWGESVRTAVGDVLGHVRSITAAADVDSQKGPLRQSVAYRLSAVFAACDALWGAVSCVGRDAQGVAGMPGGSDGAGVARAMASSSPIVLYANELCESLAIPRMYFGVADFGRVVALYRPDHAADVSGSGRCATQGHPEPGTGTVERLSRALAPLVEQEWERHREELLWDPDEAKKLAKEEDERKNKEALAAKFAHIADDPGKQAVEL